MQTSFCVLTYSGRHVWMPGLGGWERENVHTLEGVTAVLRAEYQRMTGETQ